jgi:hypothetical protein
LRGGGKSGRARREHELPPRSTHCVTF